MKTKLFKSVPLSLISILEFGKLPGYLTTIVAVLSFVHMTAVGVSWPVKVHLTEKVRDW